MLNPLIPTLLRLWYWLRWGLAVLSAATAAVVAWHHSALLGLGLALAAPLVGAILQPGRSWLLHLRHARRGGLDRSSDQYRTARREFVRIQTMQRAIFRGAQVAIRQRRQRTNPDTGATRTTTVLLYPTLIDRFDVTERGFAFDVVPQVRFGQTVETLVSARDSLAANIGYPLEVSPSENSPHQLARIEIFLRDEPDHLGGIRLAREVSPWLTRDGDL
jgi:hypothetical protein